MVFTHHNDQFFALNACRRQRFAHERTVAACPQEADLQKPIRKRFNLVLGSHLVQHKAHVRVLRVKGLYRTAENAGKGRRWSKTNIQFAGLSVRSASHDVLGMVRLCQYFFCFSEKEPARAREFGATTCSCKEERSELLLQRSYLLAERWLGNAQLGCRAREMQLPS